MTVGLSKEHRQLMIAEIIKFFIKERHEEITESEAEKVLEFIMEHFSTIFYNAALYDVQYVLEQQYLNLEEEILSLEHPMKKNLIRGN